jgi:membrane-associated phospholipid phosphatase
VAIGAVQRSAERSPLPGRGVGVGRPPWWLLAGSAVLTIAVTADLLTGGVLERLDLRVSGVVRGWDLRHSNAYWPVWSCTQAGGRVFILLVLGGLVGWLAWRRRTLLPLARVVLALALLTAAVYTFKWGLGRTAPAYPGSYFHRGGASYPSGHVANAVLMWGVARWQAVQFGLPGSVQRLARVLGLLGPVATGVAMVALDFHWLTDAVVGGAVGILLLGVVHLLDVPLVARWLSARAGRRPA